MQETGCQLGALTCNLYVYLNIDSLIYGELQVCSTSEYGEGIIIKVHIASIDFLYIHVYIMFLNVLYYGGILLPSLIIGIGMALIGQEHVFKIHFLTNE